MPRINGSSSHAPPTDLNGCAPASASQLRVDSPAPASPPGISDGLPSGVAQLVAANPPFDPARCCANLSQSGLSQPAAPTPAGSSPEDRGFGGALALEQRIRSHAAYPSLTPEEQNSIHRIMTTAATRPAADRVYYLEKLQALLDTPYTGQTPNGGSDILGARTESTLDTAVHLEQQRAAEWKGLEELLSGMGHATLQRGEGGTLYRVNRENPDLVVVQLKVHVSGERAFVEKTKLLEDAIEKAASARGYHVDLVFADHSGPDVFEVQADPTRWANSRNWAGDAQTLAHELHHLLGLSDRYDYIESHATNADMPIADRLYWFSEQMKKPHDPRASYSLMGDQWSGTMLSEDVCAVARGDELRCARERAELDPPGLPPMPPRLHVH